METLINNENVYKYLESAFENANYGCVYFVYQDNKLLYIGKTNDLKYRMTSYIRKQTHLTFNATHVKAIKITNEYERTDFENRMIKKYLPPLNYAGTGGKSERCLKIKKKFKTTFSLDKDIYEKIKEIAEKEDRNFSQQVNKILKEYAAAQK